MMIMSNMSGLPDNLSVAFPSPEGSDGSPTSKASSSSDSPSSGANTPRKNKRKLTEPKKRSEGFSIKRFCPDSPQKQSNSEEEDVPRRVLVNEYPPDTPEASPSPEHRPLTLPEATSSRDLTAYSRLAVPSIISMPVTPPITPGRKTASRIPADRNNKSPPGAPTSTSHHTQHQQRQQQHQHQQQHSKRAASSTSQSHSTQSLSSSSLPAVTVPVLSIPPPPTHPALAPPPIPPPSPSSSESTTVTPQKGGAAAGGGSRRQRKNYKNMTRERRVEANARERTRVHTISAAFESLRRAVPSYSYNQRLSKLAILKIACSYIMSLGQLTDKDYTPGAGDNPGFAQCVERCTHTIQAEGRTKRRH